MSSSAALSSSSSAQRLKWLMRDRVVKAISIGGAYRVAVVSSVGVYRRIAPLVQEKLSAHADLPRDFAACISAANLFASFLSHEERVTFRRYAPYGTPICESLALGECRAQVDPPSDDASLLGSVRIDRVVYHETQPVVSVTKRADGMGKGGDGDDDAEEVKGDPVLSRSSTAVAFDRDVQHFMRQSDGIHAAVAFPVGLHTSPSYDDSGAAEWPSSMNGIAYSLGVLVQPIAASALEHGSESLVDEIGASLRQLQTVLSTPGDAEEHVAFRRTFDRRARLGYGIFDLFRFASGDEVGSRDLGKKFRFPVPEVLSDGRLDCLPPLPGHIPFTSQPHRFSLDASSAESTAIDFHCRCLTGNRRALAAQLLLNAADTEGMRTQITAGTLTITCRYCGKRAELSAASLS